METVCAQCERTVDAQRNRIKDFNPQSYSYKVVALCHFCEAERAALLRDPHLEFVSGYYLHQYCEQEFAQPTPTGDQGAGEAQASQPKG